MKTAIVVHCEWLGGERWLTLEELAQAAGASPSFVPDNAEFFRF